MRDLKGQWEFGNKLQGTMVRTSDVWATAASSQRAWEELCLPVAAFPYPRRNLSAAAGLVPGQDQSREPEAGGAGLV